MIVGLMLAFVVTIAPGAFALPAPIEKLRGGVEGIVKSPLEIPKHTMDEVKSADIKPVGFIGGMLKGTYHTVHKTVKGALDVATFPVK